MRQQSLTQSTKTLNQTAGVCLDTINGSVTHGAQIASNTLIDMQELKDFSTCASHVCDSDAHDWQHIPIELLLEQKSGFQKSTLCYDNDLDTDCSENIHFPAPSDDHLIVYNYSFQEEGAGL